MVVATKPKAEKKPKKTGDKKVSDPTPGPLPPPTPPPAQQAQVRKQDRLVIATGYFPAGSSDPATIEIQDLDEAEWDAFQKAPPGNKHLAVDGTLTVVAPPPAPLRKITTQFIEEEVRTTNDVPVEVYRFPTNLKHVYKAIFEIMAVDATSGATKNTEARMTFKRTGAGLVQVGTTAVPYNAADTATSSWAITPSVSGTDLVISFKGALGRTIDCQLIGNIGVYAPEGLAE